MAVFVGTLSADNAAQRLQGIEDAIAGKNIDIVDKREDNTDRAKARSNVEDIINAHGDLRLVAGLWSYNGPAIAAALEALGKKGKVQAAVFDEEDGHAQCGSQNGTIAATVVQKPFEFGYLSSQVDARARDQAGRAGPRSLPARPIDTGVEVIDEDNVVDVRDKARRDEEVVIADPTRPRSQQLLAMSGDHQALSRA